MCRCGLSRETGNGPARAALGPSTVCGVTKVKEVRPVRVVMLGSASSWPPCRRWQHRRSPPTHHGPRRRHPHHRPLPPRPLVVQHRRCHWWRRLVLPPWEQAWPAISRSNQQTQTSCKRQLAWMGDRVHVCAWLTARVCVGCEWGWPGGGKLREHGGDTVHAHMLGPPGPSP